jgi:hypothetical protein
MKTFCGELGLLVLTCVLITSATSTKPGSPIQSFDEIRIQYAREATPKQQLFINSVFGEMKNEFEKDRVTLLKAKKDTPSMKYQFY